MMSATKPCGKKLRFWIEKDCFFSPRNCLVSTAPRHPWGYACISGLSWMTFSISTRFILHRRIRVSHKRKLYNNRTELPKWPVLLSTVWCVCTASFREEVENGLCCSIKSWQKKWWRVSWLSSSPRNPWYLAKYGFLTTCPPKWITFIYIDLTAATDRLWRQRGVASTGTQTHAKGTRTREANLAGERSNREGAIPHQLASFV